MEWHERALELAALYRRVDASGCRMVAIPCAIWPAVSGIISDNLWQVEAGALPDMEAVLTENCCEVLNNILIAIQNLSPSVTQGGLCCVQQLGLPGLPPDPLPIEWGVGDPPVGETWDEYSGILCQRAQWAVDHVRDTIDTFCDVLGGAAELGLEGLALYLAPVDPPVAVLLALLGVLVEIIEEELFEQWATELEWMAISIACAFVSSGSPARTKGLIDGYIDMFVPESASRLFHRACWSTSFVNRVWAGVTGDVSAYDPAWCSTCPGLFVDHWTFPQSVQGWFLQEGYGDAYVAFDPYHSHSQDGSGCLKVWGPTSWSGPRYARAQVNCNIPITAPGRVSVYHQRSGVANNPHIQLFMDTEPNIGMYVAPVPQEPAWGEAVLEFGEEFVGRSIIAIRLSYQLANSAVNIDDVYVWH